jgi:GcrA cell cycle regulator
MNAIDPWVRRVGARISHVSWNDEAVATAKRMSAEGKSSREIAVVLSKKYPDITRNAVIGKLHRLGCAGGGRPPNRPPKKALKPRIERRSPPRVGKLTFIASSRQSPKPPKRKQFGIKFVEIEDGLCRWPKGDPKKLDEFRFCGVPIDKGDLYCPHHAARAVNGTASAFSQGIARNKWLMRA